MLKHWILGLRCDCMKSSANEQRESNPAAKSWPSAQASHGHIVAHTSNWAQQEGEAEHERGRESAHEPPGIAAHFPDRPRQRADQYGSVEPSSTVILPPEEDSTRSRDQT